MKIGIVGYGIVGSAIKSGFDLLNHSTVVHDTKLDTSILDVTEAAIVYVCVDTPSNTDGSCNTDSVVSVVHELNEAQYSGIVAVKSTVEPGTTRRLMRSFPNLDICHVPEFLRERCALQDFVHAHNILIVGTSDKRVYEKVVDSHGHFPKEKIQLTVDETELVKYFSNTYKAWKVTYANSFSAICKSLGVDYSSVKDAFLLHRVSEGEYLSDHGAYAGGCLPKDVKAMASLVKKLGLDVPIFDYMTEENERYL